jgi:tetratricopeptide (TPR) repeat protein
LGSAFYAQGNYEDAIENWKKSIKLSPRADAHVNIGCALAINLKKPVDAIPHYEDAIKLSPEDGEIYHNYGVILDHCGKLEEAIIQYSNAVSFSIEPAEAKLRNARARWACAKALQEDKEKE